MKRRFFGQNKKRRDTSKNYFTIEVLEDGQLIKLSNYYEYCIDDEFWNKATPITYINANAGLSIYFKGNIIPSDFTGIGNFIITKKCNLSGNIMSLLYGDEFEGQTDLTGKDYAFLSLFSECSTIIDASQLVLPATTLAWRCYYHMFYGCSSLVTAPSLPATTLADSCYSGMFFGCSSLVTAPDLPAITLAQGCYQRMFEDCTSLIQAPELPATTLAQDCYQYMFYNCTKLNYIKALFTTTPGSSYTSDWVFGVSSSGTFVKNKDATWNVTGVNGIPKGWTVEYYAETNLITFTIDGTEYQAEEGMTWGDWVNSEYNYNNYIFGVEGTIIPDKYQVFSLLCVNDSTYVKGTDYIDAKNTYNFKGGGAGN